MMLCKQEFGMFKVMPYDYTQSQGFTESTVLGIGNNKPVCLARLRPSVNLSWSKKNPGPRPKPSDTPKNKRRRKKVESFESEAGEIGDQIESFQMDFGDSNYELIENESIQETGDIPPADASEVDIKIEEINEDWSSLTHLLFTCLTDICT